MANSSGGTKLVRFSAADIPAATPDDLARLRAMADDPVDISDIPEWTEGEAPVARDGQGRLARHPIGPIGRAILGQLDRKRITRYRLWQDAKSYCPKLSESAVYDFLGGKRQIEVRYAEALLRAVGLTLRPTKAKADKARAKKAAPGGVAKAGAEAPTPKRAAAAKAKDSAAKGAAKPKERKGAAGRTRKSGRKPLA